MQRENLNNNHSNPPYNKSRTGKNSPPPAPTPTQGPRPRLPGSLSANTTSSAGGSRDIFAGFGKSSPLPPLPLATHGGYPLCLPHSSSSADRAQVVERTDASTSASNEHENTDDIDLFGPEPDSESDVAKSKSPSPRQAGFPLCLPQRLTISAAVERSDASKSTVTSTTYGPVTTHSATSPTLDEDGVEITTKEVFERAKDAEATNNKNSSAKKDKGHSGKKKRKTPPPKMEAINELVGAPPAEPHEDGLHKFRLPRPPNAVVISSKPFPPPPLETASSTPFVSNDEQGANAAGPSHPRVTPRKSTVLTHADHPSPATTVSSSSPLTGPSKRPTATARARARTQRPPRPAGLESHEPPAQAPDTDRFWGQRLSKPSPSRSTHALPPPGQSDNSTASTSSLPAAAPRTTFDKEDGPVDIPRVLPATDVIFFGEQPEAPNYGNASDRPLGSSPTADTTPNAESSHAHAVTNESHKAVTTKRKGNGPAVPRGRKKNAQGPEGQGRAADDNSSVKKKPVARPRKKQVDAAPTSEESINSGSQGHQTSTTNTANCMESTFPAKPRGRTSSTSSEDIPLSSIYHSGVGTGAATLMSSSFTGMPSTLSARQLCGQDCISLDVSVAPQAPHAPVPSPSTLPKKNAPAAAHRPTPAAKRKRPDDTEDSQPGPSRKLARKHEPSQAVSVPQAYTQAAEPVSMGAPTAAATPSGSSLCQGEKRKRYEEPEDDSEPGPAPKRNVRFSGENSYYTTPGPFEATTSSSLDHAMDMEIVSASDIANTVPQDAGYYNAGYFSDKLLPDLPGTVHAAATTSGYQASGSSFSGTPFVALESLGDSTATPIFPRSSLAPTVSQTLRSAPAVAAPQNWIPAPAPTPAVVFAPSPSPSPPPTKQWEFFKIADNVYWGPDRESCTESCPLPYPFGLIMGSSTLNFPPGTLQNPETYAPLLDWLGYMMDTRYIPAYRQTLDPLLDWLVYMSASDTRYIPAPR